MLYCPVPPIGHLIVYKSSISPALQRLSTIAPQSCLIKYSKQLRSWVRLLYLQVCSPSKLSDIAIGSMAETLQEAAKRVTAEFDVSKDDLAKHVTEFLEEMGEIYRTSQIEVLSAYKA
jgi:hypothetical protein